MKNNITFRPLLPTKTGIFCHLLTINHSKILINCGGEPSYYTQDIISLVNQCDCILITSFDFECLGGLWEILSSGFFKPVYMSVPIKEFSSIFNEQEYDNIFDIKYLQPFSVNDIQICAYASGNSLGASLYKITSNLENIYIGFNINHRKENHLNGIDLKKLIDSYIFITNSKYCYKENQNVNTRNEQFIHIINNWFTVKSRKMIIFVSYSRFHEIALICNNIKGKRIVVLNKYINKFINKSKNMIEWSNSKLIEQNNLYEYTNIKKIEYYTKLEDFDICFILDEDITLLDEFNDPNLCVLFIDKKFDVLEKPVFIYEGTLKSQNKIVPEKQVDESSDEEEEQHWSSIRCEIKLDMNGDIIEDVSYNQYMSYNDIYGNNEDSFIKDIYGNNEDSIIKDVSYNQYMSYNDIYRNNEGSINNEMHKTNKLNILEMKIKFDKNKNFRNYDNYGEYLDKDKFKIVIDRRDVIAEPVIEEVIYTETKTIKRIGVVPKYKSVFFNSQGCSDLKNIKVILKNLESKKVIIVEDDILVAKFMYSNLINAISNVQICNSLINLSSNTNVNIVNVSDIMNNMNNEAVKIKENKLFRFIGNKQNDLIKYVKKPENISLCDFNEIKKKLSALNFKIEKKQNCFIINERVFVRLENDRIELEGEQDDVYNMVRNVLYEHIFVL